MNSDLQNLELVIIEEIRRFLQELDGSCAFSLCPDKPRILFILSQHIPEEFIPSAELTSLIRQHPSILLKTQNSAFPSPACFSTLPEIPSNEKPVSLNDLLSQLKIIVALPPSLSFMAQLTLGITPDLASGIFLQSLIKSKPVLGILAETDGIRESFIPFLNNTDTEENAFLSQRIRSSLQTLHRQYVKILEDWGITWIKPDRIFASIQKIMEKDLDDAQNPPPVPVSAKRLVIAQEDILERIKRGESQWRVPSNAIITDLALEIAEKHGFILKISS